MKNILLNSVIIFCLCAILSFAISCRKQEDMCTDTIKHDTIIRVDTIRAFTEITYKRIFEPITATDKSTNKVVRVDGFEATDADAYSDCAIFKFAGYFRINRKFGNRLTVNFSNAEDITTLVCDNSSIIIDSFFTKDKYSVSFLIRAKHDTIRDPSVKFTFQTASNKIIVSNLVDIVGEINTKCFGTGFWATRYFRIVEGTYNLPVSKEIPLDSSYIPKRGDIIYWEGHHYGTIYNVPIVVATTKLGKTTYEYRFNLFEMNAKCTGALSYKVNYVLSSNVLGTLLSYNTDRGEPQFYYRNL